MFPSASRQSRRHLVALGLFAFFLALYLSGLPSSITWEHDASDGPELATAVATWGVPHPPGYPTYVLTGRLFLTVLPVGEPALRLGVMSAFFGALAVALTWYLALETLALIRGGEGGASATSWWAAFLAATALGASPILWSQAVVVEVYALHAAFAAAILLLLLQWVRRQETGQGASWGTRGRLVSAGLLVGLGMGNHLTIAVFLPAGVLLVLLVARRHPLSWRTALAALVAVAAGAGVYVYLPLSAAQDPPINWGSPDTLSGFWWTVSGTPYRTFVFGLPLDHLPSRLVSWLDLLLQQFTLVGAGLGLLGVWHMAERRRNLFLFTLLLSLLTVVYSIGYETPDSYVYLIPSLVVFVAWMALGLAWLVGEVAPRVPHLWSWRLRVEKVPALLIAASLLLVPGVTLFLNYESVSLRGDDQARDYAQGVMDQVQPEAMILAFEDGQLFTLWYFRYALRQRTDVAVVSSILLPADWYLDVLYANHPDFLPAQLPTDFEGRLFTLVDYALERRPVYATQGHKLLFQRYDSVPVAGIYRLLGRKE